MPTRKSAAPQRLRRADSFLGIHFDFHAGADCHNIGEKVTPRMVQRIIDLVHPDFVQCDCKGHAGYASYPTQVGTPAPGLVKDPLRIWRRVTARNGVALYLHYSGVWDSQALKHHPSWARIDENGQRDKNNTSVYGPYVDKLLIPQIKELIDEYDIDGIWIDGECWATCQDYHKDVIAAFRKATGIRNVPKKPTDPHFFEFTEFCRQGFRDYLQHYVEQVHRHRPEFQIASNWAYSSFMPEPVNIDVDYLSGDYPMLDSVRVARLESRCLAPQGKPWDLMAWGFCCRWGEGGSSTKSAVQVQQEAAIVLAAGGGVQVYYTQNRDGTVNLWQMDIMAEVARFCRARQKFCHRAQAVPQVALLNSSYDFYRRNARIFSPWGGLLDPVRGNLCALLDSQNAVEVLSEHHLAGRLADYPLVVVPETTHLAPAFKRELIDYARAGGKLLIIGPHAARIFRRELGVSLPGEPAAEDFGIEHDGFLAGIKTLTQRVRPRPGVKTIAYRYAGRANFNGVKQPLATMRPLGKGAIIGAYLNFGENYLKARSAVARDWLQALVRRLFPQPLVEVSGSHLVDVNVNRLDGQLMINLVNTAGPHADDNVYTFDEIPVVGPLEVSVRLPQAPQRVTLQPDNRRLRTNYAQGRLRFTIPQLPIHSIVVVET